MARFRNKLLSWFRYGEGAHILACNVCGISHKSVFRISSGLVLTNSGCAGPEFARDMLEDGSMPRGVALRCKDSP